MHWTAAGLHRALAGIAINICFCCVFVGCGSPESWGCVGAGKRSGKPLLQPVEAKPDYQNHHQDHEKQNKRQETSSCPVPSKKGTVHI